MNSKPLICWTDKGWYPIDGEPNGVTKKQWAQDNLKLNPEVMRIETFEGEVLCSRVQ